MALMTNDAEIARAYVALALGTEEFEQGLKDMEQKVRTSAQRMSANLSSIANGAKGVAQAWMALPLALSGAMYAAQQIGEAMRKVYQEAREGAKALRIDAAFKNVAESVGADSEHMAERMSKAVGRAVEDTKLKQTAMKGMLYGLNDETMVGLAEAAKVFARSTGQDVASTFESLTNSVTMMIPRQLMRLRIVTRAEMREIQKGITLGAIGPEDIAAEVQRKAKERGERMQIKDDPASSFARFSTSWEEAVESMAKLSSLILAPMLDLVSLLLDAFTSLGNFIRDTFGDILIESYRSMTVVTKGIRELADSVAHFFKKGVLYNQQDIITFFNPEAGLREGPGGYDRYKQDVLDEKKKNAWEALMPSSIASISAAMGGPSIEDNANEDAAYKELGIKKHVEEEKRKEEEKTALVQLARNAEINQLTMKTALSTAKSINASRLDLLKTEHATELKMFETKEKAKIELAGRGGADAVKLSQMGTSLELTKISRTEDNAQREAEVARKSALAELDLEIKLKGLKQGYEEQRKQRQINAVEVTDSLGNPIAAAVKRKAELQTELDDMRNYYNKREKIENDGKRSIIRMKYTTELEKARLTAEAATLESSTKGGLEQKEKGVDIDTRLIALKLEERTAQAKLEGITLDEREAVIKRQLESLAINDIQAALQRFDIEKARLDILGKTNQSTENAEKALRDIWKNTEGIGVAYVNPLTATEQQSVDMQQALQNGNNILKSLYDTWKKLNEEGKSYTASLSEQIKKLRDQANILDNLARVTAGKVGPAAGIAWQSGKEQEYQKTASELRMLGIDSSKYVADQQLQIDTQKYQFMLDNASDYNEAFFAQARLLALELRNLYKWAADSTAKAMTKTFDDLFFDAFKGRLKDAGTYIQAFADTMLKSISQRLATSTTDIILSLITKNEKGQRDPIAQLLGLDSLDNFIHTTKIKLVQMATPFVNSMREFFGMGKVPMESLEDERDKAGLKQAAENYVNTIKTIKMEADELEVKQLKIGNVSLPENTVQKGVEQQEDKSKRLQDDIMPVASWEEMQRNDPKLNGQYDWYRNSKNWKTEKNDYRAQEYLKSDDYKERMKGEEEQDREMLEKIQQNREKIKNFFKRFSENEQEYQPEYQSMIVQAASWEDMKKNDPKLNGGYDWYLNADRSKGSWKNQRDSYRRQQYWESDDYAQQQEEKAQEQLRRDEEFKAAKERWSQRFEGLKEYAPQKEYETMITPIVDYKSVETAPAELSDFQKMKMERMNASIQPEEVASAGVTDAYPADVSDQQKGISTGDVRGITRPLAGLTGMKEIKDIDSILSMYQSVDRLTTNAKGLWDKFGFGKEGEPQRYVESLTGEGSLNVTGMNPDAAMQRVGLESGYEFDADTNFDPSSITDSFTTSLEKLDKPTEDLVKSFDNVSISSEDVSDGFTKMIGSLMDSFSGGFSGGDAGGFVDSLLTFHKGGIVGKTIPRYHDGAFAGLRSDEVPAILQKGELVVPKNETAAFLSSVGVPNQWKGLSTAGQGQTYNDQTSVNVGITIGKDKAALSGELRTEIESTVERVLRRRM